MVKAEKDIFKRVYRDDGTYYYPRILQDQLRKKGELYFKRRELKISSDGTEKSPNIYLISVYQRDIITAIEENHAEISEGDRFNVVSVKQEDGDGPHRDAV